jgi:hypothetical protein
VWGGVLLLLLLLLLLPLPLPLPLHWLMLMHAFQIHRSEGFLVFGSGLLGSWFVV